jgi:SAM-dependent methyltransferase
VGDEAGTVERRAFLQTARIRARQRYDEVHAADYDTQAWGAVSPTHARFTERFLELVRPAGLVLDMPCGTGKYWALVQASGRSIVGLDQSDAMLAVARAKHPDVPAGRASLQELAYEASFDGVMCIDSMEFVGPEDWPDVLGRLRDAARPEAPLYLSVELADEEELAAEVERAWAAGHPVSPREAFDPEDGGYHHHPQRASVSDWLAAAGLSVVEEAEGDWYWHLLLRRTEAGAR